MSPLAEVLRRRIAREGPITVADYMAAALGDPEHGYYMRGDPFGAAGDFTTSPEISQMFGELVGLWCAAVWESMGGPEPVRLAELGPGRGTLMADALRAVRVAPRFARALRVHLVETSPALAAKQREALAGHDVAWHRGLDEVPAGPLLLVANEVFDALPVHQLQMTGAGWRERMVGLDPGDGFRLVLAPGPTPAVALVPDRLGGAPAGSVFEASPAATGLAREIGRRVAADGGAALVVDYGHAESALGDTLQAVRRHRFWDALAEPGSADITAHVDFAALARAAGEAGARTLGPVPQGAFLKALGIEARAARLAEGATPAQAEDIRGACRRLIDPQQMGTLFKAMAITDPALPPPLGFGPAA